MSDIISALSYVGNNPSDESITFVKFFQTGEEYLRVAVTVTTNGTAFAKTLHLLSTVNEERYIEKGTLKSLTIISIDVQLRCIKYKLYWMKSEDGTGGRRRIAIA